MDRRELIARLNEILKEALINISEMPNNDILIEINKDEITSVMKTLKEGPSLKFDSLLNHLGADCKEGFAVIYNLYSFTLNQKITVKAYLGREAPEIASIESVFRGINWFERETFDMLGIRFTGHSNLKRLLLPPDWEGHPLRKDYVYPDEYHGIDNKRRSNFR
ncbi:MAG: NADH-quinone oxidoreductase subunit C [Nitrospirae bacterium]|nr:NADH-quinone oxidoreductase subunit C [Nitrospirota bacterium]